MKDVRRKKPNKMTNGEVEKLKLLIELINLIKDKSLNYKFRYLKGCYDNRPTS